MITEKQLNNLEEAYEGKTVIHLIAEIRRLREAFDSHLTTMEAVNQHLGYQFTQPLIRARQALGIEKF